MSAEKKQRYTSNGASIFDEEAKDPCNKDGYVAPRVIAARLNALADERTRKANEWADALLELGKQRDGLLDACKTLTARVEELEARDERATVLLNRWYEVWGNPHKIDTPIPARETSEFLEHRRRALAQRSDTQEHFCMDCRYAYDNSLAEGFYCLVHEEDVEGDHSCEKYEAHRSEPDATARRRFTEKDFQLVDEANALMRRALRQAGPSSEEDQRSEGE